MGDIERVVILEVIVNNNDVLFLQTNTDGCVSQ